MHTRTHTHTLTHSTSYKSSLLCALQLSRIHSWGVTCLLHFDPNFDLNTVNPKGHRKRGSKDVKDRVPTGNIPNGAFFEVCATVIPLTLVHQRSRTPTLPLASAVAH